MSASAIMDGGALCEKCGRTLDITVDQATGNGVESCAPCGTRRYIPRRRASALVLMGALAPSVLNAAAKSEADTAGTVRLHCAAPNCPKTMQWSAATGRAKPTLCVEHRRQERAGRYFNTATDSGTGVVRKKAPAQAATALTVVPSAKPLAPAQVPQNDPAAPSVHAHGGSVVALDVVLAELRGRRKEIDAAITALEQVRASGLLGTPRQDGAV